MTQLETRTEPMVLNFGPHHPSMHGVLRLVVTLDGEDVVDCEPVIGYLHRGMEKIAESRTNVMFVPYVSRWDYAAGMFNEAITVNAPEQLADVPVPKRASYIRVLMLELNRIANHLLWLGPFLADVGAQTPFFYIFREREMIYDLWEAATGQRMVNNNYFRIGGVAADLPWGWLEKCLDFCDWFDPMITSIEPRMAMMSATFTPVSRWGRICRLLKSAARIFQRQGVTSSLPIRNTPSSPLPDSTRA